MSNQVLNTLILTLFMAVAIGAGYFITQKAQKAELVQLEEEAEALRLSAAEVETLLIEEAQASQSAAEALSRWNARYKVLPDQLSSPDVVDYLNALSQSGFRSFDINLGGITPGADFSVYTYNITGVAFYESLYGFIWNVENGRGLFHLRAIQIDKAVTTLPNPETDIDRQVVLVRFSMSIDAYFGGSRGMSAPDSLVDVPDSVLPSRRPPINPFFPLVLQSLPPNTDDLVDLEEDELISVIGDAAVFSRSGQMRTLRSGDRVYLGRISHVDPNEARVVIDLNKGGIRERVELNLQTGERYRQALGSVQLDAMAGPVLNDAPPAPGTPEARRAGLYSGTPIPSPDDQ